MTNGQRAGAIAILWLAFAVGASLLFTASHQYFGSAPMKAIEFLDIVLIVGTCLALFTLRRL